MKIDTAEFRVRQGEIVDLARRPTTSAPLCKSDKHYAARLQKHVQRLSAFQQLLYAANRQAVLLIFQAMDAAGKDGAIPRLIVSHIVREAFEAMSLAYPKASAVRRSELSAIRAELAA